MTQSKPSEQVPAERTPSACVGCLGEQTCNDSVQTMIIWGIQRQEGWILLEEPAVCTGEAGLKVELHQWFGLEQVGRGWDSVSGVHSLLGKSDHFLNSFICF